jgi:hypothetical protein
MDLNWVSAWLKNYVRKQGRLRVMFGTLALIGGIVILAMTWSIIYWRCAYIFKQFNVSQQWLSPLIATLVILLLFWGNARTSREYLSQYKVVTGTASDTVVGFGANINPLAPETIGIFTKIIATILFIGPSLVVTAYRMFRKAGQLYRLDIPSCAAVIELLERVDKKMPYQQIVESIPGMDASIVFNQLRDIEGVLFLEKEPTGLILSNDLKADLKKLL